MLRKLYFFLTVLVYLPAAVQAQDTAAILRELVDLPAPRPAAADAGKPNKNYGDIPPPDDAPFEDLKGYWETKMYDTPPPTASVKTSLRLIEAARSDPAGFDTMLRIFPADPAVAESVKNVFDTAPADQVSDFWRDRIKGWLKSNSNIFIEEVAAEALRAKDHVEYGWITYEGSLKALARFDWERAKPLLEKFENDRANPRTAVLVLGLFYEHAVSEKDADGARKYREKLRAVVEDGSANPSVRNGAMDSLAARDWPGRDEWYLSLFENETLFHLFEGGTGYEPLTTISRKDPDKWIPILVKLVGNKNRAIHNVAVANLLQFHRKDALLPLLPWLTDPEWAAVSWNPRGRRTLMEMVASLDMPEAVPGLIWIVENDEVEASGAARSLEVIKDRRAGPALLSRIEKTKNEDDRKWMVQALIACEGLTGAEMVQAIQAYAEAVLQPGAEEKIDLYAEDDPLPVRVRIGWALARRKAPPEEFVRLLFDHIRELRKSRPDLAAKLLQIAEKWQGKAVYVEMLQRAADGDAGASGIVKILAHRKEIREEAPLELSWLTGKSGLAGALGLAVMEDAAAMQGLVNPDTPDAAVAALAFARLLRLKLPVSDIAPLLQSKNKLLALAAERYLESENSREARQVIFEAHPGEMPILGARETFRSGNGNAKYAEVLKLLFSSLGEYYSGNNYDGMEKAEDRLRAELKSDKEVLHIYAFTANDGAGQAHRVLRVYKDRATFTLYDDKSYFRQKKLTRNELDDFNELLAKMDIDDFNPVQGQCHHDCYAREFISLNARGGVRVFASAGLAALRGLDFMETLFDGSGYKLRYYLENEIKGLEVLFADRNGKVPITLWKNGSDMRVLISDAPREREIANELSKLDREERKNEELDYREQQRTSRKRQYARQYEHLYWLRLTKDGLEGITAEPAEVPYLRYRAEFPNVENFDPNDNIPQVLSGEYEVRAGNGYNSGVALVNGSSTVILRTDGWYRDPVTTADGKWAVISKIDSTWDGPRSLYRLNLATGREYKVDLAAHSDLKAVSFIGAHNKMLVRVAGSYYLLDPRTGKLQPVKGEFTPLRDQTWRGLQPAGQPDEFWAAIPDSEKDETSIGKYNSKSFVFKPLLKLPKILLKSMDIWVDENEGFVYFVYGQRWRDQAHVLRVPLNAL